MIGRRSLVLGAALALAGAALVALAPDLLPVPRSALTEPVTALTDAVGLMGLAVLAGAVAVIQGLWSSSTPMAPPALPVGAGDRASAAPDPAVVGGDFDAQLARTGDVAARSGRDEAEIREHLRRLATDAYQQGYRCDWETAARAVEEGRWTDDPCAAAFVGGADAPEVPLRMWLRAMLNEDGAFHEQTTRTIAAIAALREAAPIARNEGREPEIARPRSGWEVLEE
ncbi:MAG: hypothetical protein ABEJ31_01375 [Haloarculaceae archaeon]